MTTDDIFRQTEKRLFNYGVNITKLVTLQSKLHELKQHGDIHTQDYQTTGANNHGVSNPVLNYTEKVLSIEHKIKKLKRDIIPIVRLITDLQRDNSQKARDFIILLREYYANKHSLKEIAEQTGKSRRTLYSRRRELVIMVLKYL